MNIVDATELASDLGSYLRRVENGETLVISVQNRPVAELRPTVGLVTTPRPFGLCAGEFIVPDDFDSPLPGDILADFESR